MAQFFLGQGNRSPTLEALPLLNGNPVDVSGGAFQFFMAPYGADLATAPGSPVTIVPDPDQPNAWVFQHAWLDAETVDYGTFWFQIRGTRADGSPISFPTEAPGYYTLEIFPKV